MVQPNYSFTTVAAYPGFFVAMPVWDKDDVCVDLHESAVVAWNIIVFDNAVGASEGRSQAMPVIAEDCVTEMYFIKMPDGSYELPEDSYDLTKNDAIKLMNEIKVGR